jgi:hypothetical protein
MASCAHTSWSPPDRWFPSPSTLEKPLNSLVAATRRSRWRVWTPSTEIASYVQSLPPPLRNGGLPEQLRVDEVEDSVDHGRCLLQVNEVAGTGHDLVA